MPLEPGWEISKDLMNEYKYFREKFFDPLEAPILATRMKKTAKDMLGFNTYGDGVAFVTDKKFYFRRQSSAALGILSAVSMTPIDNPDFEDRIPLQQIVRIGYLGSGKYQISWMKVDKNGNPKLDKKGNYQTKEAKFDILKNKGEESFKCYERMEQFGYFLQAAIEKLKENEGSR